MSALCSKGNFIACGVHGVLFTQDGRYGLEEDTKDDIFTVADSSLNASAMIGACAYVPVVVVELIVQILLRH